MRSQLNRWLVRFMISAAILTIFVLIFLGISVTFVSQNESNQGYNSTVAAIQITNDKVTMLVAATAIAKLLPTDTTGQTSNAAPVALVSQKRIVIQNAALELVVQDTAAALATIIDLTNKIGGWVVTSNSYQSASRTSKQLTYGSITIRVPADQFDSTLQQIKSSAISVSSQKITGTDVTSQYVDLTSHLTNLQAAEDQLRKIMDSATKTEDVLAVYDKLVDIRGQIEQIKGQLSFYDQSAAYSSIDISLTPSEDNQPLVIAGWQPGNTVKTAVSTLVQVVQELVDLVIWFVILILPFVVLILILFLLYRRVRRQVVPVGVTPLDSLFDPPKDKA